MSKSREIFGMPLPFAGAAAGAITVGFANSDKSPDTVATSMVVGALMGGTCGYVIHLLEKSRAAA